MAKMRTGALRKLHADLGKILEDYDASCAEQSAAADEDDDTPAMDNPPHTPGTPRAPIAGADSAPRGAVSMREGFGPNWNRLNNR